MTAARQEHPTGYGLLHNPRLNKGTAFTEAERRASSRRGPGHLGAGGMGFPIGNRSPYTACAGVPPPCCLPVVLDVGTNNQVLLDDPLYLGLCQQRVRGADYLAFVDEFVAAVPQLYPKCCIQWEDFANFNAFPILARYREQLCT